MSLKIPTVLLSLISYCYGANILAILPTPSYSHQIAYTHIWKELSLRGHKVTLITTDPLKDPKLTNLTEIDVSWSYELVVNFSKSAQEEFTMWNMHKLSENILKQVAEKQVSSSGVQDLIHNKKQFDVVLVEFLYPEYLAFAKIYNCPKIIFGTLDVFAITHHVIGNSISPILYPEMGATFYGKLNFRERVISTLYTWHTMLYYYYTVFNSKTRVVKKYFNISTTVYELLSDVDLMFLNVNPILQPIRALGPSTITIGGERPVLSTVSLPEDIAQFLDNAVDGFIYFSLGSNVKSKDLNKETFQAVIETLRELPYKVLWKFEADKLPNKPENVKFIKWAPQQTVLSHPNIKLFITQGGLQSIEEAFYCEVPLVIIPFFGDQEQNAQIMKSKGFAVVVNRKPSVNKIELKSAILEVINNPKYRNTVKRLSNLARDTPMTGVEKAVWWTEYVIRNKGAKHLRNPAADLPFYQYYLFDVVGFLVLSTTSIFLCVYLALRTIYRKYLKLLIVRKVNVPTKFKKKEE